MRHSGPRDSLRIVPGLVFVGSGWRETPQMCKPAYQIKKRKTDAYSYYTLFGKRSRRILDPETQSR